MISAVKLINSDSYRQYCSPDAIELSTVRRGDDHSGFHLVRVFIRTK